MLREIVMAATLVPKTSGGRPPFTGGPIKTGFSGEPDDSNGFDMLVVIKDQVERLIREAKHLSSSDRTREVLKWVDLLDLREKWLLEEIATEKLLSSVPAAPLGIEDDTLDLGALRAEFESPRMWQYKHLLGLVREAKSTLLDELGDPISDSKAS